MVTTRSGSPNCQPAANRGTAGSTAGSPSGAPPSAQRRSVSIASSESRRSPTNDSGAGSGNQGGMVRASVFAAISPARSRAPA